MPALVGQLLLIGLIGYLWGSIPAGYWMGKLLKGGNFDIRDYGSHKIGATNVLRTLGRVPAAIVFIFDLSKGILPTLLATLVPFFYGAGWGPHLPLFLAGTTPSEKPSVSISCTFAITFAVLSISTAFTP